jgi:hypothetical protein
MIAFSFFANGDTVDVIADDVTNELTQAQFVITNPIARLTIIDGAWTQDFDADESKTVAIPAGHNADDVTIYFTRVD